MTQPDENALDPQLRALLHADFAPASTASKDRVSDRVVHSLGVVAMSRVAGSARTPGLTRSLADAFHAHRSGFITCFVLGAAVGSGLFAAVRRPQPARIVYVDRIGSAAAPVPATPAPTASPTPSQPADTTPIVDSAPPAALPHNPANSLAEQQKLLDAARIAFARNDYPAASAALATHFQRYPKSMLAEEREALEIKTLAASGHESEAKARAARFNARFPQSVLAPSVRDSVGAIP